MKEELTLKNLTGYIAYGLKFISELDKSIEEYGKNPIWTLNGFEKLFGDYCLVCSETNDAYPIHLCKPIFHPLKDLLENEYHFIWDKECEYDSIDFWTDFDNESFRSLKFSFGFWNELYKNHFDVFGLIEKGLAIDINTIQ